MNEFQDMIEDIVKKYRLKLHIAAAPSSRQQIIIDMKDELLLMKQTWEILHPQGGGVYPSFESANQIVERLLIM